MNKKKGCLPGCLGAFWALVILACGGGPLRDNGPAASRDYLQPEDVILIYAWSGPENAKELAVFAVKRGETKPAPWASMETDDLAAVTAINHVYMGNRQFPYYKPRTPFYYGVNGRHVAIPHPEAPPVPDLRPPEPENNRMEVVASRWSPDGRYLAYTIREKYDRNRPYSTEPRRLFLLDTATEESRLLREDSFNAEAILWSEDGRYLFANVGVRLERWDRETDSWLDLDWQSNYVESSADGQLMIWHNTAKKMYSLSDASGENRRQLLDEGSINPYQRAWSPDGRYLAFQSSHAGYNYIHVADLQEGTVKELYKRLTPTYAASGFTMTWSPDSSQIAFLGLGKCVTTLNLENLVESYCNHDVYVVPLDGGAAQRITNTNNDKIWIESDYTIGWLKTTTED